jgi:hypothetical protein
MEHFYSEDSPAIKLAEAASRYFGGDEPSEPHGGENAESIEIRRSHYYGGPRPGWMDWSDMPYYGLSRTLWPLEAILGTTHAAPAADITVRDASCGRYLVSVQPGAAADLEGVTLVDRPKPDDPWRMLHADVCIDRGGLVRRIAWSPVFEIRTRPGVLPRLLTKLAKDPTGGHVALGRLWNLIEFWEYGCEVQIAAPTTLIDHPETPFRKIVYDFWRMRREHKRRTRQLSAESALR